MKPEQMALIIENECKKKGISVAEMLKSAKLTHNTVIALKNGHYPTVKNVIKISLFLEISADILLGIKPYDF